MHTLNNSFCIRRETERILDTSFNEVLQEEDGYLLPEHWVKTSELFISQIEQINKGQKLDDWKGGKMTNYVLEVPDNF